jgi:glycosyltransferase involved in cell wall biosynthesis
MRIAVVGGAPPNREGEAHYTDCVFRALASAFPHAQVRVLAHRQRDCPDAEYPLPNYSIVRVTEGYHPRRRHLAPLLVRRALRAYAPDIVHFQAPHKALYGGIYGEPLLWVFRWLKRMGVPTVVTLHSLWLEADFQEMAQERRLNPAKRNLLRYLYRRYHQQLFSLASQVNALVAGDANPLIHEFQSLWRLERFTLVNEAHPCEPRHYSIEQQRHAKEALGMSGRRLVLAFGFVRPDKGFHHLMDAVYSLIPTLPDLQLLIAGEPRGAQGHAYAQQLQARYTQMGCPAHITLDLNYLPDTRLELLLTAADVLVVPYTRVMGASGPVHHALSFGKPVVATDLGQNRGLADVCWLVPPQNPDALAQAILQLLTDDALWDAYHRRAHEYATTHTWNHLAARYYRDYQRLLGYTP